MKDPKESPGIPPGGRSLAVGSPGGEGPSSSSRSPETANSNGQSVHNETAGMLALIERVVLDPAVDVEKLERLLAVQERILDRNDKLAFNAAKGRILKKLAGIQIVKRKSVSYEIEKGKPDKGLREAFKYAPLEDIDKVLAPLLADEEMELTYSDEPTPDGRIMIRGRLKHLPGSHFEDSFMPAPLDTSGGKNNVQAVGSTNSYLRRYVACNVFNIVVVGDDDDGIGGPITDQQVVEILGKMKEAKAGPKFLKYMRLQPVEDSGSPSQSISAMLARDYRKAVNALDDLIAKQGGKSADTNC